jgi:hypothetical protein
MAKGRVSHSQHGEPFGIVRLVDNQFGGFTSCGCQGCGRSRFIIGQPSDNAFAPGPRRWNPVLVTSSDRQSNQGASGTIDIALADRLFKPKLRYVFTPSRGSLATIVSTVERSGSGSACQ